MICYRDMTFCVSPDCKNDCGRKLTQDVKDAAEKWWGKDNGQAPIAMSCFCGGDIGQVINKKELEG